MNGTTKPLSLTVIPILCIKEFRSFSVQKIPEAQHTQPLSDLFRTISPLDHNVHVTAKLVETSEIQYLQMARTKVLIRKELLRSQ